jgi:outer membrane biosynthesis protein TonB
MNKRTFAFGVGAGLLTACAIFFVSYTIQKNFYDKELQKLENDINILEEELQQTKTMPDYVLQLETPNPVATQIPTEEPQFNSTVLPTQPPTPEPTLPPTQPPTPEPTVSPTQPPTPEPTVTPTQPPTPSPTLPPTSPPVSEVTETFTVVDDTIMVYIPPYSTATTVATLLEEQGIIEDSADYLTYLKENFLTRNLISGNFYIKKNSSYNTITDVLTGKY